MATLQYWSLIFGKNGYVAPELQTIHLHGHVYGHDLLWDSCPITTSPIVSIENGIVTTKTGTKYTLGEVDPAYGVKYPDALKEIEVAFLKKQKAELEAKLEYWQGSSWNQPEPISIMQRLDAVEARIKKLQEG